MTLTDNGPGDYTLTLNTAYASIPHVQVTSATAGVTCELGTLAAGSVQVLCVDTATGAVPTDGDFHVTISGSDAADEV